MNLGDFLLHSFNQKKRQSSSSQSSPVPVLPSIASHLSFILFKLAGNVIICNISLLGCVPSLLNPSLSLSSSIYTRHVPPSSISPRLLFLPKTAGCCFQFSSPLPTSSSNYFHYPRLQVASRLQLHNGFFPSITHLLPHID